MNNSVLLIYSFAVIVGCGSFCPFCEKCYWIFVVYSKLHYSCKWYTLKLVNLIKKLNESDIGGMNYAAGTAETAYGGR